MDIKEFSKLMQKHNEKDKRWSIIDLITFVLIGIVNIGILGKFSFPVFGSIMILFFAMHYLKSYLSIMVYMGIDNANVNDELYKIARTQAFPVKKYFDFLRKKLVVWQAVIFVFACAMVIIEKNYLGLIFAVIMGLIPSVMCDIFEKRFKKKMCSRDKALGEILGGFIIGITSIVECALSVIFITVGYFLLWAIISDGIFGTSGKNIVVYRTYEFEISFNVMIIMFIVCLFSWMYPLRKKAKIIRIIIGVLFIALGIVDIVMENNMYTEIYEDKIIVSDFERKKEYSIEEIESFKVYEEDDELQVKLIFKDGFSETLFGSVATNSDEFDEEYYSIYNFMEKMISVYMENGAKGEMDKEDMEELREMISGYDKEIRDSFERIVELMS
ncbi:MAG: hypothetical protein IJA34_08645 [Lachnospiraceae bacterium]|nr:hypothetical protein [Lachnospiraceae bacterium]